MPVCKNCEKDFPNYLILEGKKRNLSKREFCISCSPFGMHNTQSSLEYKNKESKICPMCKIDKSKNEFYKRRKGKNCSSYCIACTKKQTIIRQRQLKEYCIQYKGGSCKKCGYNKCNAALDFHHENSNEKDFEISKLKQTSFSEKLKKELDKCILLCANCHREEHSKDAAVYPLSSKQVKG